ncbi:hypothetical protein Pint_15026 [Pistacia integerrima]|uniref:Uncharacterized protein n=1 Tax=Pistacia integerrima TaxID=434235 RepID=A0ACC0ZE03_9ROSI|nr:hypothetical protein Pint_15026 [Pistacia integerrima]
MAVTSEVVDSERVIDVDFDVGNGSPQELISYLKSSFRESDFAKAESFLMAKEAKLRLEIETTQQAYEWLSEKLVREGMEKHKIQEEFLELKKLNFELTQEKNIVSERQRKAENEAESWRNKYTQLESRISNLEADSKLLLNVDCSEPNVRVSGENAKDVKLERGKANVGRDCYGGQELPSRSIVEIIDSDDDCSPEESSSKNEMTSPRVPSTAHSGQTGGQSGTRMLKGKLDACLSVSESKIDNNVDDVEVNNSATADCKTEKLQKLTHEHDGSGQIGGQSRRGMLRRKLDACLSVSESKIDNNVDDVEVNNSATADCKTEKLQKLTHEHDGSGQIGGQSWRGMLRRKLDACLSVSESKIDNNVDDVEVNNSATADCKTEKLQELTYEHDGSGQTGVQSGTGMLKRKLDTCLSVSENKIYNTVEVNSSATADCNTEKLHMLTHEHDGSPVRHSTAAIPPSSNDVEKLCTSSSQGPDILRQCEEKMEREHTSQNLKREFLSGFPAAFDIDDISSSSSSSSDSDDDSDMDFDFSQLIQTKTPQSSSSTKNRGFSHSNALRGTTLAEFLIDGNPLGRLRKSIRELEQYDEKGLDDCKKLATEHSKQLFEIYQSKEDPLFFF